MKRLLFIFVTLIFIQQARAQLQQTFSPNACQWQQQPASGAYAVNDELDRLKREKQTLKSNVKRMQKKIEKIDERIGGHRDGINRRLQPQLSTLVVDHIEQGGSASQLMMDCSTPTSAPSVGSSNSNVPVSGVTRMNVDRVPAADAPPDNSGVVADATPVPSPSAPAVTPAYQAVGPCDTDPVKRVFLSLRARMVA